MAKITDMIAKVNKFGIIQGNNYRVIFSGIAGAADTVVGDPTGARYNSRMSLSCDSITMPGRSLSTNEFKTIGVARELPYERLFSGDVSMTFLFGRDMLERKIFETWMDYIINPVNNRFSYYDEYVAEADIILYDNAENPVYKCKIEEMYPKEIGAVELSNETDAFAKQTITFSFRKYTPMNVSLGEGLNIPEGLNNVSRGLDELLTDPGLGVSKLGDDLINKLDRSVETIEKFGDAGRVVDRKVKKFNISAFFGKYFS